MKVNSVWKDDCFRRLLEEFADDGDSDFIYDVRADESRFEFNKLCIFFYFIWNL